MQSLWARRSVDMIKLILARGIVIDDKALFYAFDRREIAANTVITDILLGLIQDVNHSRISNMCHTPSSFLDHFSIAGNISAMQTLLARGATQLPSALHLACGCGRIEVVKLLLHEAKARPGRIITDEVLREALRAASRHGQLAVVLFLFQYDADADDSNAQLVGHSEVKSGSWITSEAIKNSLFATLHREVRLAISTSGQLAIMKFLIEHGADAEALNAALCRAVSDDIVEAIELLLGSGADINVIRPRQYPYALENPLIIACRVGRPTTVRLLLARGADPNQQGVPCPLITAMDRHCDRLDTLKILLEYGADPNDTRTATSPLKAALQRPDLLKLLLEHGAYPNLSFRDGSTALLEVLGRTHMSNLEVFTLLLQQGADPNLAEPRTGETPLMLVATAIRVEYVKLLLEYGADVTQVNTAGQTVLDMLGRTRKYGEVVELCTSYVETNKPGAKLVLK